MFYKRNETSYLRIPNICNHITHKRRVNMNQKNTELNEKYFHNRNNIKHNLDGYEQTTFNLVYDININEYIRYIVVNKISVCEGYQYKDLLSKHYE